MPLMSVSWQEITSFRQISFSSLYGYSDMCLKTRSRSAARGRSPRHGLENESAYSEYSPQIQAAAQQNLADVASLLHGNRPKGVGHSRSEGPFGRRRSGESTELGPPRPAFAARSECRVWCPRPGSTPPARRRT